MTSFQASRLSAAFLLITTTLGCGPKEAPLEAVIGIRSLTARQASLLVSNAPAATWDVGFIKGISPEDAEIFSEQPGGFLPLVNLVSLTAETAEILATFRGALLLDGLPECSAEVAQKLSEHKGLLSLGGLTSLDLKTASALGNHDGDLYLNGLTSLDTEAAVFLADQNGMLSANSLATVSLPTLRALCQRKSPTSLGGVLELNVKQAKTLQSATGLFFLSGIRSLPTSARNQLKNNKNIFLGLE